MKQDSSSGNADSPLSKDPEILREEDHKIIVEYEHLRAEITHILTEEEISVTASIDKRSKDQIEEPKNLSEFEKKWRFLKKMFVNQIFANSKKGSSLNIKGSVLKGYFKWVQTERGLSNDVINDMNLSRKVLWFLKELGEFGPDLLLAEKAAELSDVTTRRLGLLAQHLRSKMNDIGFVKKFNLKFETLKSTNPEMEEMFKQLESGKVEAENNSLFAKFLREIFDGEDENFSRHIALLDNLNRAVETNNPSELMVDELRQKLGDSLEVVEFQKPKEDDIVIGETVVDDSVSVGDVENHQKDELEDLILIEIEKAVQKPAASEDQASLKPSANSDSNKPEDPLEDFKKPLWATDEGKETKEFSEFEEKPDVRRREDDSEDSGGRGKTRDGDKHIDDEL